jgi:hypothetical protein
MMSFFRKKVKSIQQIETERDILLYTLDSLLAYNLISIDEYNRILVDGLPYFSADLIENNWK